MTWFVGLWKQHFCLFLAVPVEIFFILLIPLFLILQQSARGGTVHSHDTPNGMVGAGHGGSSVRGQGFLGQGSGVSAESYRRRHEITVTVSIWSFLMLGFALVELHSI